MSASVCLILDAAVTVQVAGVLFDGSLGDEGRVLGVTWYLHGPTHSLSWRTEGRERGNVNKKVMAQPFISSEICI